MQVMETTFSTAVSMIEGASRAVEQVAQRVATGDLSRLERDMVELTVQETTVEVAAAIVQTEDEMLGTVVDIVA